MSKDYFHQVLLTPQVLNFWDILLLVMPTQSTGVPDCVPISTIGCENGEKVFNELLSSSSVELEISGVSSLQLLMIVYLFTVIKKYLLQI